MIGIIGDRALSYKSGKWFEVWEYNVKPIKDMSIINLINEALNEFPSMVQFVTTEA